MIKIDKAQIVNEFKTEHPEYADKDIFVDTYDNSYSIKLRRKRRDISVSHQKARRRMETPLRPRKKP